MSKKEIKILDEIVNQVITSVSPEVRQWVESLVWTELQRSGK